MARSATSVETSTYEIETPRGVARVDLDRPSGRSRGLLVLGHGAAGGVNAPDLEAVRRAALTLPMIVARVTQPYRLLGRKVPPAAPALDEAWLTVVADLRARVGVKLPLVVGGRSSGARVAARTAAELGAVGVLALAFPLHPPGRPGVSRAGELDPERTTLVINGDADPFGVPESDGQIEVVVRPGERHDLRKDTAAVAEAAIGWLRDLPGIASLNPTNPA